MSANKVIVIGGGPAGLMAAGQAALDGAAVTVLERMKTPGRKLNITGKGRCNLTNIAPLEEFLTHFGRNGRFLRQAFNQFFSNDLAEFLAEIGVTVKTERGGRVFPENDDAPSVTRAMVQWAEECGVRIKTESRVEQLVVEDGHVTGVAANGQTLAAEAVIIATGGKSYPATGSTGDGYRLAEAVGHTIVPVRPALVPLETAGDVAPRLQGLSLRNVVVKVMIDGRKPRRDAIAQGEMLFTHFGLSGPIVLTLSRMVVDALNDGSEVTITIDLKPALDEKKLDARLLREFSEHGQREFHTILRSLLPRKLIDVCVDLVGIAPEKLGHQITSDERKRLRAWLKDFRFDITGHRDWREAIVTAGGVSLKEIDPRTMASRLAPNLYFAGEVLDIDGATGGYNLQAAFSTGWLAGKSAAP